MAQAYYRPPFKKQLSGSVCGPYNCNMAAAAMLADRDTLGATSPTPDAMRKASGTWDRCTDAIVGNEGTSPQDAMAALSKYGVTANQFDRWDSPGINWDRFVAAVKGGVPAMASGDYDALPYNLKGDKDFHGTHQVYVNEVLADGSFLVYDPIADGRRAGIPKSPLIYPASVMKAYLDLYPGTLYTTIIGIKHTATVRVAVANVRSGPGTNYGVIRSFKQGQTLQRGSKPDIGQSVGGSRVWYRVWVAGIAKVGWMHASVVTVK